MLWHLAAASFTLPAAMPGLVAAAQTNKSAAQMNKPTGKPAVGNNSRNIAANFFVASPFSAEYNSAAYLADRLLVTASNDKTARVIEPQLVAFDSYASLLKKLGGVNAGSVILPLEFFNPQGNFIDQANLLNLGYHAMAVLRPVPLFLLVRSGIKTIDQLLQKPTARAADNLLLAQLLDNFLTNQFAKLPPVAKNNGDNTADNDSSDDAMGDTTGDTALPIAEQAATSAAPPAAAPAGPQQTTPPARQGALADYYNNFVGHYNNDEALLQQFAIGQIDWFFSLGFLGTPVGEKFLKKTGARVFSLAADSFGNVFGDGNNQGDNVDFITCDITTLKNGTNFAFPLLWLIKGDDAVVKTIDARTRTRGNSWVLPREQNADGSTAAVVRWNGFSFTDLLYHPALLS